MHAKYTRVVYKIRRIEWTLRISICGVKFMASASINSLTEAVSRVDSRVHWLTDGEKRVVEAMIAVLNSFADAHWEDPHAVPMAQEPEYVGLLKLAESLRDLITPPDKAAVLMADHYTPDYK